MIIFSDNETTVHPLEEDDIHIIHEVYFHEGYPDATEVLAGNVFDVSNTNYQ